MFNWYAALDSVNKRIAELETRISVLRTLGTLNESLPEDTIPPLVDSIDEIDALNLPPVLRAELQRADGQVAKTIAQRILLIRERELERAKVQMEFTEHKIATGRLKAPHHPPHPLPTTSCLPSSRRPPITPPVLGTPRQV